MDQPDSDIKFLIEMYLLGELDKRQSRELEAAAMKDPELERLIEERLQELDSDMLDDLPHDELAEVEPMLDARLKDICVQAEARPPHRLSGRQDRCKTSLWLKAGAFAAAAALILAYVYGTGSYETDITDLNEWPQQESVNRHDWFIQVELKRKIDNAHLIQHGRGDAATALPMYDEIANSGQPHLWATGIASQERAAIIQASSKAPAFFFPASELP